MVEIYAEQHEAARGVTVDVSKIGAHISGAAIGLRVIIVAAIGARHTVKMKLIRV
jgi:hypothetical protein